MMPSVSAFRRFSVFLIALPFSLGACESGPEEEPQPIVVRSPLEHDPLDHIEIGPWWSNGSVLLRLDDDGHYVLYRGMNRYRAARGRGRWSQPSYAVMWLEPYDTIEPERVRVSISRVRGELALTLPRQAPMFAIAGPPRLPNGYGPGGSPQRLPGPAADARC